MRASITILILSLIAGFSPGKPIAVTDEATKTVDCANPNGYSVVEVRDPRANYVNIVQGDKVLNSIRLPTGTERNGFGFSWAKKTKAGFEISVEYGSRYYYGKRFNFICKRHKFFLSRIIVDSYDRNPVKTNSGWEVPIKTRVVKVKPNLSREKFVITDFMLEGVVR